VHVHNIKESQTADDMLV